MIVPGANLLNMALGVIGAQTVIWRAYAGRTENALGQWVTTYADPVPLRGSWQPLDRTKYEALGLDLSRTYHNFYASAGIDGINRGESPDLIEYQGRRHEVVNELDWRGQDGWRGVLVIDVGAI